VVRLRARDDRVFTLDLGGSSIPFEWRNRRFEWCKFTLSGSTLEFWETGSSIIGRKLLSQRAMHCIATGARRRL
jgi:hypothetical protein